jgi:hypothetical protein
MIIRPYIPHLTGASFAPGSQSCSKSHKEGVMASELRIVFTGGLHHVTSSGNTVSPSKPWQWLI